MKTKEEIRKMMGIDNSSKTTIYKLNKIQMSGDTGKFILSDLLAERKKGDKVAKNEIGEEISGVILKLRWMLSRYEEPSKTFYSSTEYDDKWQDEVTVFPSKEKGSVEAMKAKYNLSTQRVVYFYLPSTHQVVRLIVKASALSGKDKNPNGENGLFEHQSEFEQTQSLPCEFITECKGVFRAGKNDDGTPNKRKDHFAMTFKVGRKLTDSEFEKIAVLIEEVDFKTANKKVVELEDDVEDENAETTGRTETDYQALSDDINPDDIPF